MVDTIVEDCWQTAITVRPILPDSFAKLRRVDADLQDQNDEEKIQDFAARAIHGCDTSIPRV
jgi:hypothetical protein